MRFKRPIYRILFFAGWIALVGGIITLLIAANRRNSEHLCKGVEVTINGGGNTIYVDTASVIKSVEKTAGGSLVKKHFGDINLTALEKNLERNAWILDAELYFDTKDILHVSVSEREPIARVFTTAGSSFYMDSTGHTMPLLEGYSAKLPVVTGFTAATKWSAKDSIILTGVKNIIRFVVADEFWNAQIGQIDITPDGRFEAVPTVGSHIIKLGDGENIPDKLNRLLVFYKQVIPKAGLTKYSVLNLEFDGQVVAVKKGPQSPVDSIQLQRNIQQLMRKKMEEQEADSTLPAENLPAALYTVKKVDPDSFDVNLDIDKKDIAVPRQPTSNPTPIKKVEQKSNVIKPVVNRPNPEKPKTNVTKPVQKPKAVMQPKNEY